MTLIKLLVGQIKKDQYSAILISHALVRNFNAIEIANKIKQIGYLSEMKLVLLISAYDKSKLAAEDLKIFNASINKPIKEDNLIEAILDVHQIKYDKTERLRDDQSDKTVEVKPYKILMCEDNKINIKVALAVLNKMGYEIDVAEDGKEGFEKVFGPDSKEYDLIFMDCMMPVMDGYSATIKIRQEETKLKLSRKPIIALTANISQSDKDKCFEVGMDDFLSKPLKKEDVASIIKKWTLPS